MAMKILMAVLTSAALLACGKKNASTTPAAPASATETQTEMQPAGTGGSTYGGTAESATPATEAPTE